MAIQVRTIDEEHVAGWVSCMMTGFLRSTVEGDAEFRRPDMDLARSWGALEGERVVGTLRTFPTPLTVPGGGMVSATAVTNVTVAPTNRRRGLLNEMMGNELRHSVDRGEAVGILIASEYPIYGRFGFGPAVESATYSLDTPAVKFLTPGTGSVELVDLATLRIAAPPVYEAMRRAQPGAIERTSRWWDTTLRQVIRPGAEKLDGYQAILRSDDGEVAGYVRYRAKDDFDQMRPVGVIDVDELVAVTPAAYHRLWEYCCGVDLITTVNAADRSVEETLPWLLSDGRALRQTARFDFLWVRILDVPAALGARRYLTEDRLVLGVTDHTGIATGRYLLDGGSDGVTCVRTKESADLSMPVDGLGSVYMGGISMRTLGLAGRVEEHRPGALARADAMFRSAVTPWCSTWF